MIKTLNIILFKGTYYGLQNNLLHFLFQLMLAALIPLTIHTIKDVLNKGQGTSTETGEQKDTRSPQVDPKYW